MLFGEVEVHFIPFKAHVVVGFGVIEGWVGGLAAGNGGAGVLGGVAAVASVLHCVLKGDVLVLRYGGWGGGRDGDGFFFGEGAGGHAEPRGWIAVEIIFQYA